MIRGMIKTENVCCSTATLCKQSMAKFLRRSFKGQAANIQPLASAYIQCAVNQKGYSPLVITNIAIEHGGFIVDAQ